MGVLTDDMQRLVREQRLGFVATVNADGTPNLSPKGTTNVWDDEHLIFADIASPQTMENLSRSPAVEVNVVDPIARKGYRFKGTATIHAEDDPLFAEALRWYATSEGIERDLTGKVSAVVLIRVEQAAPLLSPAYAWGETEEELVEWWTAHHLSLRHT